MGRITQPYRGTGISHPAVGDRPSPILPALATTFAELDRAGLRWCLLRGEADLERPGAGDVDLLLAAGDVRRATAVLDRLGYLPLPGWGRGSHRFFLAYDRVEDAWIKLDIVTRLAFGPHAVMETDTAAACLDRRLVAGGPPRLVETDRFWALLLHCVLDRGDVPAHHATALRELAGAASAEGPLATWFDAHAPGAWSAGRVMDAAAAEAWDSLVDVGRRMRAAPRWRRPRSRITLMQRAIARRMTKVRILLLQRGIAMALLGPDGAGKSTLAAALANTFHLPVRSIYMGLYGTGPDGRVPRGMVGRVARLWRGYLRGLIHRSRGRLVIYDRFGYDALLRQPAGRGGRARLRRWLLARAVPAPHLVVVLDVPAQELYARKQEHDVETLEVQRAAYLDLASRIPRARIVGADRHPESVRRDVTAVIWDCYRRRRRGRRFGRR